jgi:hypothetical protein
MGLAKKLVFVITACDVDCANLCQFRVKVHSKAKWLKKSITALMGTSVYKSKPSWPNFNPLHGALAVSGVYFSHIGN